MQEFIQYTLVNGEVKKEEVEAGCDYHGNNEPRFSEYRIGYFAEIHNSWEKDETKKCTEVRHIKNGEILTEVIVEQ